MASRKQIKQVAVIGPTGMLGFAAASYYKSRGYKVVSIDRSLFDALKDDISILEPLIKGSDFVINCLGIIKPRIATMSPEQVLLVNGTYPKNLAKLTKSMNIPCFHITTDCVYSGKKGSYSENDPYDIDDLYGLSKNAGENTDCMTIRTSIIGEEIKNKYSLIEWAISQKGKEVSGFTNHIWNGVTTLHLAGIIEQIILNNEYQLGIFHIHSPKSVSKYELLKSINNIYNLNLTINTASASTSVDRSLISIFPLSKSFSTLEIPEQIKEMHDFFLTESV